MPPNPSLSEPGPKPEEPVEARPAATVIVARDGGPGLEVLMLRRTATSRFAPGFVVFPGGSVDPGDESLALRWFGSRDEVGRACAVRELAEETGLVLTGDGLVEAPGMPPGTGGLTEPRAGQVPEIARWIAPDFLPVRFDARFYAATGTGGLTPHPDGVEAEEAWWSSPSDVLDLATAGDALLMWPTLKMLEALRSCRSVREVMAMRVPQVEPPVGIRPARTGGPPPSFVPEPAAADEPST